MRIAGFRHKGLKRLYETGSRRGVRPDLVARVENILHAIEQAQRVEQIGLFPGWKLHPLKGGRAGERSVWVTGNYRLTFRADGEEVLDLNLEDYHGKK
jgi:proteic killer suppression protein